QMSTRTIHLMQRHFHCPSVSEIRTVMDTLPAIEAVIPNLGVRCVSEKTEHCRLLLRAELDGDVLVICPPPKENPELGITSPLIGAAGISAGLGNASGWSSVDYDDFTVPASHMVRQAGPYQGFAFEVSGHRVRPPPTIPCAPIRTQTYVSVPTGAGSDPTL